MITFLELYNEIEFKIKQASLHLKSCNEELFKIREERDLLKIELEELKAENTLLLEKYNLLSITKTILKKEDKKETIKKINNLVREIDNCIMLLNRDK